MKIRINNVIRVAGGSYHVVVQPRRDGVLAIPLGGSTNADARVFSQYRKVRRRPTRRTLEAMIAIRRAELKAGNLDSAGRPRK